MTAMAATPHRIVIVGGGAGGLELATRLGNTLGRRGQAEVTLVEKTRTHVWKPKLHEIAAGSMDMSDHEVGYLAQGHWHHFKFRIGQMVGLDRQRREVLVAPTFDDEGLLVTPQRAVPYDTLVIAVGSQSNDFGTPGVREHALRLESAADALRFHQRLVNACVRAHAQAEPLRPEQLHLAIIGAGATGVELAAELHRTTREVVAYGLDRVDADKDIQVTVVEAAPRVLPALPERLSTATEALLSVMDAVAADLPVVAVAAVHRVGMLAIGDVAVVVAASAAHRDEAFLAARRLIDDLKATVPIWKRQVFTDGEQEWVGTP